VDNSVKTILKSYEMKCRQHLILDLQLGALLYNNALFKNDHCDRILLSGAHTGDCSPVLASEH